MTDSEAALIEQLGARAAEAASVVVEVADWPAVAGLAIELAEGEQIAVAPSLLASHPEVGRALGDQMLLPAASQPFESVADAAVGMVEGVVAVAETGSILLAQHDLTDRAVGALSRTCLHVVETSRIVPSLDEAAAWLEQQAGSVSLATLVTGPSRTADIERSLTIGVQGPGAVHVVLVG